MTQKNKIYFASDFHLGTPSHAASLDREKIIVHWLDEVAADAKHIYLLGDLFDFWFEYSKVIPKGYIRFLGKIAELSDRGIPISIFTGNHDIWMFDYFEKELNIPVFRNPVQTEYNGKKFYIGHGDGLGPGDYGFKFIKKVFTNRACQFLFNWLHPNIGIGLADFWSKKSRQSGKDQEHFLGAEKELLILHANQVLEQEYFDYFIFGHRHTPVLFPLSQGAVYVNTGDWLVNFTYAVFDGNDIKLCYYLEDKA